MYQIDPSQSTTFPFDFFKLKKTLLLSMKVHSNKFHQTILYSFTTSICHLYFSRNKWLRKCFCIFVILLYYDLTYNHQWVWSQLWFLFSEYCMENSQSKCNFRKYSLGVTDQTFKSKKLTWHPGSTTFQLQNHRRVLHPAFGSVNPFAKRIKNP